MSRPTTPEGIEKQAVKDYLNSIGAWHFWPVQSGMGTDTSDCHACIEGRFWLIEVKSELKAKGAHAGATKRQQLRMDQLEGAGGCAVCGDARMILSIIEQWRTMQSAA